MWDSFIEAVFPTVLLKCTYEKTFIANVAKLGSSNASKLALVPATCNVLVNIGTKSKNMNLAEYSLLCLTNFVKMQPGEFFDAGNVTALNLVASLSAICESNKPRLVKLVKPIFKDLETKGVDL